MDINFSYSELEWLALLVSQYLAFHDVADFPVAHDELILLKEKLDIALLVLDSEI